MIPNIELVSENVSYKPLIVIVNACAPPPVPFRVFFRELSSPSGVMNITCYPRLFPLGNQVVCADECIQKNQAPATAQHSEPGGKSAQIRTTSSRAQVYCVRASGAKGHGYLGLGLGLVSGLGSGGGTCTDRPDWFCKASSLRIFELRRGPLISSRSSHAP